MSLDLSVSSYNHELKHIASILSKLMAPLGLSSTYQEWRPNLEEIRDFNENLWLCCLLTYGHQEIRFFSKI